MVIALGLGMLLAGSAGQVARASGATITVAYAGYDSLDPQAAYTTDAWQVEYATCATLLNYSDDPAPNGWQLLPDAATALPTVSPDGLTYTFTIRSGLGFSDGSGDVTPDSFVRAFERLAKLPNSAYGDFTDIAGIGAYHDGSASSISGLQVSGSDLDITLNQADNTFPARLAIPSTCAIPASTPLAEADTTAFPTAGPYYVDPGSVRTDGGTGNGDVTGFHLLRNPYYGGSRPASLDEIDVTVDPDLSDSYAAAQDPSPTVDYTGVPSSNYSDANASFGPGSSAAAAGHQQYFATPDNGTRSVWMNTSRSGLQNIDVRKAIATAIDRNQLAFDFGDGATDNFVASSMPGYQAQNTYNLHGDVSAARTLMADAGYGPGNHLALTLVTHPGQAGVNDLVSELESIYIDATTDTLATPDYYGFIGNPASQWDLTIVGWIPDFADMDGVIGVQFDGRQITGSSVGSDFSQWNDAQTNAAIDYANSLTGTDARGEAFEQLAQSLATVSVPGAAFGDILNHEFVSSRVGCVVYQPVWGLDLGRLCLANQVGSGGTYTQPGTVSPDNPVQASVTTPTAGDVSVVTATNSSQETGYDVIGKQLIIDAPAATASSPLSITLTIDGTTLGDAGVTADTVSVLRNGVSVPACTANDGTATPDPCVSSRVTDGFGNGEITILTSAASTWSFAVSDSTHPTLNTLQLTPSTLIAGRTTTVSVGATSDASQAEFYVDTDHGAGNNIPMSGSGGTFTTPPYGQFLSVGYHRIGARVRNGAGNWSPVTTTTLRVVAAAYISPPSITGTPAPGQVLTGFSGTWVGPGVSKSLQWLRCNDSGNNCVDVGTAGDKSYLVKSADKDRLLEFQVSASGPWGNDVETATAWVPGDPPQYVSGLQITGTPVVGATLTVNDGVWTGTRPFTISRSWMSCGGTHGCSPVGKHDHKTYLVRASDVGDVIVCVVDYSNGSGGAGQGAASGTVSP